MVLLCAVAAGEEERLDLAPAWTAKETCRRVVVHELRLSGVVSEGNLQQAVRIERDETIDCRDKILDVRKDGVPDRIERTYLRYERETKVRVGARAPQKTAEKDPAAGTTRTLADRQFLTEFLEGQIRRAGIAVGETWESERQERDSTATLKCKVEKSLNYRRQRAVKLLVTLKFEGKVDNIELDTTFRGYVYWSLDGNRIAKADLKGFVKMETKELGKVTGSMREVYTLDPE